MLEKFPFSRNQPKLLGKVIEEDSEAGEWYVSVTKSQKEIKEAIKMEQEQLMI